MEITTPLGADVLLFYGMHAREEMSRLSEFQIDLLSAKNDIKLDDILGKNVTVTLGLPNNSTRYFNGFVTRFAQGGMVGRYHHYQATVRPWLWFLTRTADCRIFQEMNVPDILKKVLGEDPQADLLRAVPRDRLQFREPADGGGRHLLLLPPHQRPQHDGADRLHQQAREGAGLRD